MPDFTTFWRFREALAEQGLIEELFSQITRQLEELLSGEERAIFGDKAYPSQDLKLRCRREGIYYGVLDKAYRGPPLSRAQQDRNTRKPRVRRYVEPPFAAIKDRYGMRWATAKTKLRNKAQFVMSAICWNIERGISWAKKQPNPVPAGAT